MGHTDKISLKLGPYSEKSGIIPYKTGSDHNIQGKIGEKWRKYAEFP